MGQLMSQKWIILSHCSAFRRWARCHGYVKFMAAGLNKERKPQWHENERRRHWYRGSDPSGGGVFGKSQLCSVLSLCHSCKAPLKFSLYCMELNPHLKREKTRKSMCKRRKNTHKSTSVVYCTLIVYNCVMGLTFSVLSSCDFSYILFVYSVKTEMPHRGTVLGAWQKVRKMPSAFMLLTWRRLLCSVQIQWWVVCCFFLVCQEMLTLQWLAQWISQPVNRAG